MIVYKIENICNGKAYVGVTTRSLRRRFQGHLSSPAGKGCRALSLAIKEFGAQNFRIEQVAEAGSVEEMLELERYYIGFFCTYVADGRGYNLTLGGDGSGTPKTEAAKRRMSVAALARANSPAGKASLRRAMEARLAQVPRIGSPRIGANVSQDAKRRIEEGRIKAVQALRAKIAARIVLVCGPQHLSDVNKYVSPQGRVTCRKCNSRNQAAMKARRRALEAAE